MPDPTFLDSDTPDFLTFPQDRRPVQSRLPRGNRCGSKPKLLKVPKQR